MIKKKEEPLLEEVTNKPMLEETSDTKIMLEESSTDNILEEASGNTTMLEEVKKRAEAAKERNAREAEAKRRAEEDAKRKALVETKRKAEEEAKRKAELEAKRRAEIEAKRKAEEEARSRAKVSNESYISEKKTADNKWLYFVIGVLATALIGLDLWAWNSGLFDDTQKQAKLISDTQKQTKMNVDNTNTTMTAEETDVMNMDDNKMVAPKSMNLRGYIGKYPITMYLDFDNKNVNGYYYYDNGSTELQLTGTVENDHIELNETTQEGRPTGHFDGELIDDEFFGEFINYKGEHFNFTVTMIE